MRLAKDVNFLRMVGLWAVAGAVSVVTGRLCWLAAPVAIVVLNEALVLLGGFDVLFSGPARTTMFYDFTAFWAIRTKGGSPNLSEGFYNGDLSKTPKQAEDDKFERILKMLGVEKGMHVLDIGCGCGTFVKYMNSHGYHATGTTNSVGLVDLRKEHGQPILLSDYHNFDPRLEGRYDAIVMMGCLEHCHWSLKDQKGLHKALDSVFRIFPRYLKQDSKCRRIFFSTLHINPKLASRWIPSFGHYLLERAYGCCVCTDRDGERLADVAAGCGYKLEQLVETTDEYYLATINDPSHFGHTSAFMPIHLLGIALVPIYPILLHFLLYSLSGAWMWMFSGEYDWGASHKSYCLAPRDKRPVSLIYAVCHIPADIPL
jgi:SAM-dependent methyltransferase